MPLREVHPHVEGMLFLGVNDHGAERWHRKKDGALVLRVPGGPYAARPYEGDATTAEPKAVEVPSFFLDQHEVTNEQFARFLNVFLLEGPTESSANHFSLRGTDFVGSNPVRVLPGRERHPVTIATGHGAAAYAKWVGGRLPTKQEWEKAAGGPKGRIYPWGDAYPTAAHANFGRPTPRGTMPVGSYAHAASPYGHLDMAGNVYERVIGVARMGKLPVMIKGGSWLSPHPLNLRVLDMCMQPMGVAERSVGFRVAMDDPEPKRATWRPVGTPPALHLETDWMDAIERAQTERKPIFLSLQFDTCGQCDRTRAQLFNDPKFIDYCNKHMVVVVGHQDGDAVLDPHPEHLVEGQEDGRCSIYPQMACWQHAAIFRQALRVVERFRVSPGHFVLHPDHVVPGRKDKAILIPERELSKWGADVSGYLRAFERARALLAEADKAAPPAVPALRGRLEERSGQLVLTVWGTPRERGFAHGYLLADRMLAGAQHDFGTTLKPFLPLYKVLVRVNLAPKFLFSKAEQEELQGIFDGIKAKRGEGGLVLPALGREIDLLDLKALNTFGDWYGVGCASAAFWGKHTADGEPLVGRNFDFPGFDMLVKHQLVVVRAPAEGAAGTVSVTYPGSIGTLTGMSDRGVYAAVHDVPARAGPEAVVRNNVPRLIAVRRLLEQVQPRQPMSQARELLAAWPTLYGNNIMLAAGESASGRPRVGVLEYDGRLQFETGATLRLSDPRSPGLLTEAASCVACTNDHLQRADKVTYSDTPCWRYPLLTAGADKAEGLALDSDALFGRMAQAAFPRGGGELTQASDILKVRGTTGFGTLHQAVAEPTRKRLRLRLARFGSRVEREPVVSYDVVAATRAAR